MSKKYLLLFFLPLAALFAQSPEAHPAASSAATDALVQTLRTAIGETQEILKASRPREAQAKLAPLLAAPVPSWDRVDPQAQSNSRVIYSLYGFIFHLAGKAFDAGGDWEKSLEYYNRSKELYEINAENVKATFPLIAAHYKSLVEKSRAFLAEDAEYIKTLRAKQDPDLGDTEQLVLVDREEESIVSNLKQAETFQGHVESSQKEAEYYGRFAALEESWIKAQVEELEKYQFKNNKVKFVEGIMASKGFLEKTFPELTDRVRYLYRLNVLDPSSDKVTKEIETLTGVRIEPVKREVPASKPEKKSGSKQTRKG